MNEMHPVTNWSGSVSERFLAGIVLGLFGHATTALQTASHPLRETTGAAHASTEGMLPFCIPWRASIATRVLQTSVLVSASSLSLEVASSTLAIHV